MKIYTKTGDRGETSLIRGVRVSKDDIRIEAYGTVDELCCTLGIVRTTAVPSKVDDIIARIQRQLFSLGAQLATPGAVEADTVRIDSVAIDWVESQIDGIDNELTPLKRFILPGGSAPAAQLHFARSVCRRAERRCVSLGNSTQISADVVTYLNRLSDLLFVLARYANSVAGIQDVEWHPDDG